MTKSFILDWQKDSVLLCRGRLQGSQAKIDSLASEAYGGSDGQGGISAKDAVKKVAAALHAKGDVTVLAARDLVELRTLQIPKMDADDLPDVIRFQAQRQFTNMTDAWVVDFVLLPEDPQQEMRMALVAAMSPAQLAEIDAACETAGLHAQQVLLRPLEIARTATQSAEFPRSGAAMVVCVNQTIADLLFLRDGQVIQVRSTRLPDEAELRPSVLLGEVKRSLLAAAEVLSGRSIESILLVSSKAAGDPLEKTLVDALEIPVKRFLLESLLPETLQDRAETEATRLAAIAGVLTPGKQPRNVIDFKSPKRRPPPKKNTRTWVLAGAAASVILLAGLAWYTSRIRQLNAEYATYTAELRAKEDAGAAAEAKIYELRTIEEFLQGAPNWLDELAYIAERMPPATRVKLESPSFSVTRDGEGVITVTVKADDAASIADFEDSLRSANHAVSGTGGTQLASQDGDYRWRGQTTIRVAGRGWSSPLDKGADAESTGIEREDAVEDESVLDSEESRSESIEA